MLWPMYVFNEASMFVQMFCPSPPSSLSLRSKQKTYLSLLSILLSPELLYLQIYVFKIEGVTVKACLLLICILYLPGTQLKGQQKEIIFLLLWTGVQPYAPYRFLNCSVRMGGGGGGMEGFVMNSKGISGGREGVRSAL